MEHLIASIFHVTDLHLFIDEAGNARPIAEQHATVRFMLRSAKASGLQWLRDQVAGFSLPNMTAWLSLVQRLPQLVRDERQHTRTLGQHVPILVLQTGDVETFGFSESRARGGRNPFPGFSYLHSVLWPAVMKQGADAVVDLYGNHDVWSGTWPLLTPVKHIRNAFRRITTVTGLGGPWPDRQDFPAPAGCRIELYRMNSVAPDPLAGSLASGSVGPHPPLKRLPLSKSRDAFRELLARANTPSTVSGRPIRILAMHHPPHFFDGTLFERFTSGRVAEAEALARCVKYTGVQLVLAGHRHELNPARGMTYYGNAAAPNQAPLNSSSGQLVSESPTAGSDLSPTPPRNSTALYRLHVNDKDDTLRVERAVLRYRDGSSQAFQLAGLQDVFRGIPLQ